MDTAAQTNVELSPAPPIPLPVLTHEASADPTDGLDLVSTRPSSVLWSRAALVRGRNVALFRRDYQLAKRAFDIAVSLLLLPAAGVVLGACAALVWLNDPGPVFFVHLRTGRGGRQFKMFKLRTMVKNAAELKEKYAHLNTLTWPDFKIADDPRVTWIGRILRKTSLDELPQIFNVLLGHMSLVGPRPTSFDVSTYALRHTERLEVVPGITGLWQISGRSDIDFDERVKMDTDYIEQRSMWLDLCILLRTFTAVVGQRGAY